MPAVEERMFSVGFDAGPALVESSARPLDELLLADGFASLPSTRLLGAVDVVFEIWRVRFAIQIQGGRATTRHATSGTELGTGLTRAGFLLGFEPLRFGKATVWGASGVSFGTLGFDGRTEGVTFFEPQLKSWERGNVAFEHVLVPVEFGYEYLVPLGGFTAEETYAFSFGARGGYAFQTGGSWSTKVEEESRSLSGPKLDLSGLHFRVVVGITAY